MVRTLVDALLRGLAREVPAEAPGQGWRLPGWAPPRRQQRPVLSAGPGSVREGWHHVSRQVHTGTSILPGHIPGRSGGGNAQGLGALPCLLGGTHLCLEVTDSQRSWHAFAICSSPPEIPEFNLVS